MNGLPDVTEVRSLTRFGLSAVTIVFEEGADIYLSRQLVAERLSTARAAIPEELGNPTMGPISTGLGEIYHFEVKGDPMCEEAENTDACYTPMELRSILDWYIAYQLRPVEGVVEVNSMGGFLKTWQVTIDPQRLRAFGLSLNEVYESLEANNASAGGGYIAQAGEQRIIRGEGLIRSLDELSNTRITTQDNGTPVFVKDIGEVEFAPVVRQGAVSRDGRGEAVTGIVMMLLGENSRAVTERVKSRIDELEAGLPEGVTIEPFYDRSKLIDRAVNTVATNLIEGGTLVIVVLLLMLGNLRGGLIVASIIPLSLLITFIVMNGFGVSGNLMSLGALDFGLIIDGAIVITENITLQLSQTGATGDKVSGVIREASKSVMRPVIFGTAIIMIVYVPIFALEGTEGKMFRPMAIAVLAALFAALILAITYIPALSTLVFRKGVSEKEPWLSRNIRKAYDPLIEFTMRRRAIPIATAVVLLAGGAFLATTRGAEFIPQLDEGALAIQSIRPPSASLEQTLKSNQQMEKVILEEFPDEVRTVVSKSGRPEIATDPMGIEISDVYVMLNPREEWTRVSTQAELVDEMQHVLFDRVPGQNYSFSQPIELRTNELISGVRSDVAINIYGPDLDTLESVGDDVQDALHQIDGATGINMDRLAGLPTLSIDIDRQRAARYGLNAADVLDVVAAIGGRRVGTAFEGQERYAFQVRLNEASRSNIQQIRNLFVTSPTGESVPLSEVATVTEEEGPAVINRENAQRRLTVQVNVQNRDLAGFVAEARETIDAEVDFPAGYFVTWGGQFENLERASSRLLIAVPAALILILILLLTTFGSLRPALIIYLNIPMAAVGGIAALYIRDMPFSISAAVGFIALSGIAVLNGVVLVSYIRDLQAEGYSLFEASELGAKRRLRPVLMTALTDGLGFIPMALSTSAGAEVQRPLATVVIGGLVTATFLTLFVLPTVYSMLGGDVKTDEEADA
jgi:cobalt-zinc-cadmium resistance protein CzcA